MESTVWRLQGIDTGGADLILSRIVPWSAGGAVPVLSIDSSFVPTSGALENLLADDDSVCVFAAADVRKPAFYVEFMLSSPATPWGFRFSGPSADNWPLQHQVVVNGQACSLTMLQWFHGGLTRQPDRPLLFGRAYGDWQPQTAAESHSWQSCAMSSDGRVMLATPSSSTLRVSTDGGATWMPQAAAGARSWQCCAVSSDGQVMLVGGNGTYLYLSTDGGVTWVPQTATGTRNWQSCAMSSDGQLLLALAYGGYVYVSTDGGATWTPQTAAGSRGWQCCAVSSDGQVMLVGEFSGYLYVSADGGATWVRYTGAGAVVWRSCAMSSDGQVMLGAVSGGYLYLSTDGGVTWAPQASAGARNWRSCAMSSDGQLLLALAYGGYVYVSTDGGATWTPQTAAGSRGWQCCAVSSDGQVMLAGANGGYLYLSAQQPSIYVAPPTRQSHIAPTLVQSNQASLRPQGLNAVSVLTPTAYDTEHAGPGTIHGTVEQKLTSDATLPLKRRVRLHRSRDGLLVRETWSDENGHYRFDGLNTRYEYDVIAWDHERHFRSTIANNLKPEVLP